MNVDSYIRIFIIVTYLVTISDVSNRLRLNLDKFLNLAEF